MKRLWQRTTPLQLTSTLLPSPLIPYLLTVLLQEHMRTSSLISLNKPKKMPTRAFKSCEVGTPAQPPWRRPSFDLGSHPFIWEGSVRLGIALLRDRSWVRRQD